jgi:hypothetical protein
LGLRKRLTERDQRKARQEAAQNDRALAAARGWTRPHDKKYSNKFIYLNDDLRSARGRALPKTSLIELKQLWLMSR